MSHPSGGRLPDDGPLERLVARLESVGSAVGVIRLVERWAEHRPPTRGAMLAECRAFINLRLMDRAWVRLRELADPDSSDLEVLALTAEMFIARGWPARALRLTDRLRALGLNAERLRRIEDGASEPPVRPPANARDIERSGTVEQQIRLAEVFLATGSMIRARGLLERLGRAHGSQPRVQQLLWGIRGEFTAGQQALSALVTELQAGLSSDGVGWDASEPTASLDHTEPETAEASKVMRAWQPNAADRQGAFSGLFRMDTAAGSGSDDELEDDVTVAAVMASQEEMAEPPTFEHSDPDGVIESSSGDTQIMQVIGSGENARLAPVSGQVHTNSPQDRGPVDLRKWRAEHGVGPSASLLDSPTLDAGSDFKDEGFLEEEDEDVVVMTRQEEPVVDPRTPMVRRSPISVIEKVPAPPPPIPNLPAQDEATPPAQPSPLEGARSPAHSTHSSESADQSDDRMEADDDHLAPINADGHSAHAGRSSLTTLLAVGAVLMAVLGLLIGVVSLRYVAGNAQSEQVRQAVLDSHPATLLQLRTELKQTRDGDGLFDPAQAHVAARLVLVDLALWENVSGDPGVLNEARALASEGLGGPEAGLAVAWLDRVADVKVDLKNPNKDPLTALLLAEESIDARDWAGASKALEGVNVDVGVRVALADIRVRDQMGSVSDAAIPAVLREHPLGQLWLYSGGDPELSKSEQIAFLTALRKSLPEGAAKLVAQAYLAEAEIHESVGRNEVASEARELALKANPNDPTVLSLVAASKASSTQSIKLLRHCLRLLVTSPSCQRGLIQVHIEEGNVSRAEALVKSWQDAGVGVGQLGLWVALEQGDLSGRPDSPNPADRDRSGPALVRYLDALAQKGRSARQSGIANASKALEGSGSMWDRRLATYVDGEKDRLMVLALE